MLKAVPVLRGGEVFFKSQYLGMICPGAPFLSLKAASKSENEGSEYLQAIEDALNAGHERFSFEDRDNVKKVLQDVRLDPELAKDLLSSTARKAFMGFITRSRNKANKLESAKELKALVYFSNLVVTPLLEDINVRPPLPSLPPSPGTSTSLS